MSPLSARSSGRAAGAACLTAALTLSACSSTDGTSTSGSGAADAGTGTAVSTMTATAGQGNAHTNAPSDANDDQASSPTAAAGIAALGNANTEVKTQRAEAPAQLLVTAVRIGNHDSFERVVFDLEGQGTPGWFVDYTKDPAQQGSGNSIPYEGAMALNVNIDGTVLPFEINREDPNIGTVPGRGGMVTQVVSAGTFEGRSQFVIGLDGQHPYSVQVLQNPTRLVIDISRS